MVFILVGAAIIAACVVIFKKIDLDIVLKTDWIKRILLGAFAFLGGLLVLTPFVRYVSENSRLKRETAYLKNEVITENARRGDISEALVYEITQHNDKANEFVNGYNIWFGTPMFKHDPSKYIVSTEGYVICGTVDDIPTDDETTFSEDITTTDEETTMPEDTTIVLNGQRYKLIEVN